MIAIITRPEGKKNSHYEKPNFELVEMVDAVCKAKGEHFEEVYRVQSGDNHALTSVSHTHDVF